MTLRFRASVEKRVVIIAGRSIAARLIGSIGNDTENFKSQRPRICAIIDIIAYAMDQWKPALLVSSRSHPSTPFAKKFPANDALVANARNATLREIKSHYGLCVRDNECVACATRFNDAIMAH